MRSTYLKLNITFPISKTVRILLYQDLWPIKVKYMLNSKSKEEEKKEGRVEEQGRG